MTHPKKNLILAASFLLLLEFLIGCGPTGFRRTSFKRFKNKTYYSLGIKISLPRDSLNISRSYYTTVASSKSFYYRTLHRYLYLKFHPVWVGSWLIEPFYLWDLIIVRMTQKSFEELFQKGKHDANKMDVFWHTEEHLKFHNELFEEKISSSFLQGKGEFIFFRKDHRAPYGDYIVIGARLLTNYEGYTSEEQTEDIAAIKRIINSVKAYR